MGTSSERTRAVRRHVRRRSSWRFVLKLAGFLVVAVALLYSRAYLENARHPARRVLRAAPSPRCSGIFVLVSANSLLTVYLGVELLALSVYALVAFDRDSGVAAEAAMKYFVLGAIASGRAALRHVDDLRPDRHARSRRRSPRGCTRRCRSGVIARARLHRGRRRLQARRGAVPHVAAGRLRGRADQRDAVHRHGAEDRLLRAGAAPAGAGPGRHRRSSGRRCWRRSRC